MRIIISEYVNHVAEDTEGNGGGQKSLGTAVKSSPGDQIPQTAIFFILILLIVPEECGYSWRCMRRSVCLMSCQGTVCLLTRLFSSLETFPELRYQAFLEEVIVNMVVQI